MSQSLAALIPPNDRVKLLTQRLQDGATLGQSLGLLAMNHLRHIAETHSKPARDNAEALRAVVSTPHTPMDLFSAWQAYAIDATQRGILSLEALREVGNTVVTQIQGPNDAHPVLLYDYDVIIDGKALPRPVNYLLVQIRPTNGVTVDNASRPYMIIDPRAGHGPGIGGFKSDSQVGVALAHGHPVYFVIFRARPEPGQTLADVTAAEGRFVREIATRHPDAPKPVIVGNCQGGWAAMLLAASNPDVTGPIVVNGGPMSFWAGVQGKNPLRYLGGLTGGAWSTLLLSDLCGGEFDGANLVLNFETMNPGNTWWRKYVNLFINADTEPKRFIEFERWWSGYYFMNEAEIRWIVENLFVGNRLQKGTAILAGRGPVELRKIKAPIIIFASHGDDITPPQQALNWVTAVYESEQELRACGQRIIYMVHPDIGHLGIFVSAKVARKEHDRIVSTLETIESLAPGLYEMKVAHKEGEGINATFTVGFEERTMADLQRIDDGRDDEHPFAAVDRVSQMLVDGYEMAARPLVRASVSPAMTQALVHTHPLRLRRYAISDLNPAIRAVPQLADAVREARRPAPATNPFIQAERLMADMVESSMNFCSEMYGAWQELTFFALWGNPMLARLGEAGREAAGAQIGETLRELPAVQAALMNVKRGGYAEAVIRMLILMARSRGEVRQSRLERSNEILNSTEPFRSLGTDHRNRVINEQTLIIDFAPDTAVTTLPNLLPEVADRERAIETVQTIAGELNEMSEATLHMVMRLREVLGLSPITMGTAPVPRGVPAARRTRVQHEDGVPGE
jgi:pimeloyl-ACP methyl ester carboxylesterase/tellurite resistance protein